MGWGWRLGATPRPALPCPASLLLAVPHWYASSPRGGALALRHTVMLFGSPSCCHAVWLTPLSLPFQSGFTHSLSHYWLTPCHTSGSLLVTQVAHSLSHKWLTPCHTTGSLFVTLLAHSLSHYWLTHCHTTGCWLLAHSLSHYWLTPTGSLLDCPLPLADVDDSPPSRTT